MKEAKLPVQYIVEQVFSKGWVVCHSYFSNKELLVPKTTQINGIYTV